ncbi:hypothetical protein U0038_17555 [Sphingobacterium spiritivorum]|uniref:Uncharacterized protein n=1 Tax=Sphingobacterium spiritivorum ATCC 33861 TaxID=525373 RepID=D7VN49_SPHSI|nr:hypothetical protein [Sphingobacterium spiritivorum]EFK57346.1 hypothetical protein HMPREF0766_12419 [Sphingobacterium spiritivorum ATCC 33861]QQT36574.1 hypothetical protein I6J01_03845 [Sphingobacterium spiritivorum]WQD33325.1 hypothetical protein U0038_17555 [Sphingobacterium spiritivorum]SUJ22091.1 Uncharacterised protein [Sphingobacterium spiritivorum]
MTNFEIITSILAFGTLLTGTGTIILAWITNETNKKIAKRQGVIDLHNAWNNIRSISKSDLITPDIVNATNALSLTASLWNNSVMEKNILYQSYWSNFKNLYDTLASIDELVPGHNFSCKSLLTADIKSVYKEMEKIELSKVSKTNY